MRWVNPSTSTVTTTLEGLAALVPSPSLSLSLSLSEAALASVPLTAALSSRGFTSSDFGAKGDFVAAANVTR